MFGMRVRGFFLNRLSDFLTAHGLGRSELGRLAVNDRHFVGDLERGHSVALRRIEAVEEFIEKVEADPKTLKKMRAGSGR